MTVMNGNELIRKLRKLARERGVEIVLDTRQGKGSHAILYFGERWTVIKDRDKEIGVGLLKSMLKDLGVDTLE